MNQIPPPDDVAHRDNVLMADVTEVNTLLGRYVLRFLDTDARRAAPLSTKDERALAVRVAAVAKGLQARANRRDRDGEPPTRVGPSTIQHSREPDDAEHIT
jgi:hypothetical protein